MRYQPKLLSRGAVDVIANLSRRKRSTLVSISLKMILAAASLLLPQSCNRPQRSLSQYDSVSLQNELQRRRDGTVSSGRTPISTAPTSDIVQALQAKEDLQEKTVHGIDHRLDWFEIQDPEIRLEIQSVPSEFDAADLTENSGTCFLPGVALGTEVNLCSSERYLLQPAGAKCTAFVVSENVVATAGHCINAANLAQKRFVFGYRMTGLKDSVLSIDKKDVYKAVGLIDWQFIEPSANQIDHFGLDYALVQVDRPMQGHPPLSLRKNGALRTGDGVYALGYPYGLPVKFSGVGAVSNVFSEGYFSAPVDTFAGNSGSPVINSQTREVEGVLVRGDVDWQRQGTCYIANNCPDVGCKIGEQSTLVSKFADKIPSSTIKSLGPAILRDVVKVFSSGPKLSGSGKEFSPWYSVEAAPPAPGYKIAAVDFSLTGDRRCNAWSECRLTLKTDTSASFQFRLQGHDEWPAPGQAKSEGHLVVTYSERRP